MDVKCVGVACDHAGFPLKQFVLQYLEEKGYSILARDWKDGHRDLDLVAMDGDTLVFVEVKTRSKNFFNNPEEAVGLQLRHRWH